MKSKSSQFSYIVTTAILLFSVLLLSSMIIPKNLHAQPDDFNESNDYKIGAEDVLQISVWENEHLNRQVFVRPDGKISFPLVDDLAVAGLSTMEIKKIITEKLTRFINNPEVTVTIKIMNNYKVYFMGAVNVPGVYNLKRKTSLLQLFAMAGGLSLAKNIDLQKAYILREKKRLAVDFEKLIEEGDVTQNVELLPDDVIYIPDNYARRITVIGEVASPGTVVFKDGITVLDAVLMSGGATEDADMNDTIIVRETPEREEIIRIRLKDIIKKGKLESNIKLEPGDKVVVPASLF